VGKKWSLKIEKIEKVAQVPPVNQATPTSQPAPPAQDRVTQLMNTPGALLTSSLSKQGFNPKIIYTPEQIAAFRNRLDADLKQEYAPILSLFNGEYLNEK